MRNRIIMLVWGVLLGVAGHAQTVTISGYVKDQTSGEELIGANVYVKEIQNGTVTNPYGFYSLSLPTGEYTLVFSFIGYNPVEKQVQLTENTQQNIRLLPEDAVIEEVVVTAEKKDENITRNQMSVQKLEVKRLRKLPAFMGEVDVIKAIQLLPGVQSTSEGSSGFSVRGGSADQNLILLDEATVYNASHLLGFFSVFNNDAINNVELYKGDIPARYGGRLSSVLDVRMKNGNTQKFSGSGGIGNISSRLTLEGPLVDENTSYILSGRRTYFDLFIPLIPNEDIQGNQLYFYDFNAKLNHRINQNNRLYFSSYFGRDYFNNEFANFGFGNQTFTFRWNHLFSEKLFANTTLLYSRYDYELGSPTDEAWAYLWTSKLVDYAAKIDFNYFASPDNEWNFGLSSTWHNFDPGRIKGTGEESIFTDFKLPNNYALEHAAYLSNQLKIGGRITLKYGLRASAFQNVGKATIYNYNNNYEVVDSTKYDQGEIFNTYWGLEPRVGFKFMVDEQSSLKASYSRTRQYVQLAQNSTAGTPLDLWFPASPNVEPQVSDQYAIGYFRNFFSNDMETSVEAYYKKMHHTIDFKDHANMLLNPQLEGELRFGEAMSYGVELMVKFNRPRYNGWVSYTYSHTERTIPEINEGEPYLAPYDKPHDISFVFSYLLTDRLTASANWVYATGQPVTFPTGRFEMNGKILPVYSDRNAYRMEDYHRLDLSLTWESKKKPGRKWHSEWNLSVYNAYARKNTWAISFLQDENDPLTTYAEKTYLFSAIPALTYNFKF